jgi:hypothetical protein
MSHVFFLWEESICKVQALSGDTLSFKRGRKG